MGLRKGVQAEVMTTRTKIETPLDGKFLEYGALPY
jgi:hypothetical protein